MQSLNNLSPRGRQLLIGAITVFILLPLFYFVYSASNNSNPAKRGTYYDEGSGQTVTNNNQTPETYGTVGTIITYLGTSGLLDIGVTKYQITALKSALKSYATTRSPQALEFSVTTKTITVTDEATEGNSSQTVMFELVVDRKDTYRAKMRYSNLSTTQITLTERDGDLVYASKEIDGSTISE